MTTTLTRAPIFRTAEGEFLDLSVRADADYCKANYPAIMATRPIGMSDEYQFMPSFDIAKMLHDKFDMRLVEVGQQFSRSRDPAGQEHFMKFRFPGAMQKLERLGDSAPELVIMNSHNGRSTIRAYAGIFRMVCSNGMVVSETSFGQIKLRHFGEKNSFGNFKEVLGDMARRMNILDARLSKMNSVLLDDKQQRNLARMIMKKRVTPSWFEPEMALQAHREADAVRVDGLRSLWVTFNVIQENLTAKTIVHERANARPVQIRPLTGARAHLLTNERIWAGLESFVEKEMSHLTSELFDQQIVEGVATDVLPQQEAEPVGQEATTEVVLRTANEILALATYDQICGVSEAELAGMTADERKKLSSRKSYLKRKEAVPA